MHEARAQRGDDDTGAGDLLVQALAEAGDVGLGRRVDGEARRRLEAGEARHVEQPAPPRAASSPPGRRATGGVNAATLTAISSVSRSTSSSAKAPLVPKPALFTTSSTGRSSSAMRAATASWPVERRQIGDEHLDAAELVGQRRQPVGPPGDGDDRHAGRHQLAGQLLTDAARRPGDERRRERVAGAHRLDRTDLGPDALQSGSWSLVRPRSGRRRGGGGVSSACCRGAGPRNQRRSTGQRGQAGSRERHRVARAGARQVTAAGAAGPTAAARPAAARGPGRRRHQVLRDRRRDSVGVRRLRSAASSARSAASSARSAASSARSAASAVVVVGGRRVRRWRRALRPGRAPVLVRHGIVRVGDVHHAHEWFSVGLHGNVSLMPVREVLRRRRRRSRP